MTYIHRGKESTCSAGDVFLIAAEDLLEKEMATDSSTFAWRIPWTRSLVGCSPRGRKELDTTSLLPSLSNLLSNLYIYLSMTIIIEL